MKRNDAECRRAVAVFGTHEIGVLLGELRGGFELTAGSFTDQPGGFQARDIRGTLGDTLLELEQFRILRPR